MCISEAFIIQSSQTISGPTRKSGPSKVPTGMLCPFRRNDSIIFLKKEMYPVFPKEYRLLQKKRLEFFVEESVVKMRDPWGKISGMSFSSRENSVGYVRGEY